MKIFWSWQSDTPGKTGRHFVRDVLREVIEELKQSPEIQDAEREELHLDHDIQNVPGSPDLAATIFEKIEQTSIFIADVTSVGELTLGESTKQKKLINPNVAIELGYALRTIGASRVLLVFNEYYGQHDDLPFDLRHKGGAITFSLSPDAAGLDIKACKSGLRARFKAAIGVIPALKKVPAKAFEEIPNTYSPAAYFEKGFGLATLGDRTYSYDDVGFGYVRIIPTATPLQASSLSLLKERAQIAPMLTRYGVASPRRTSSGPFGWNPNPTMDDRRQSEVRPNFIGTGRYGRSLQNSWSEKTRQMIS